MSFVDDAENANRDGYLGRGCGLGTLLDQLGEGIRQEVLTVLRDRPDITAAAIRRALAKRFDDVPSANTIQRHRRGVCKCRETQ